LLISLPGAPARGEGSEEADETPQTASETGALPSDYYETATVRARPLASSVASVTVLTREEIAELGAATVVDVLRFVEGVALTSNGGRAGVTTAQIRGGDPNFTVVLVDGVPLNDSTDQFGGAVNLNSIPVEHIERIEVVRGPVSSYYGSAGMAGVINVITRPGGGETKPGFGVAAGNAAYGRITASLGGGGEATPWFVGVSGEQEDERIADDEFQQIALQGRHTRDLGQSGSLRLAGRVTTWDVADYADGSGGPVLGSGELRQSDHDEASLDAEWRVGPERAEHRVRASGYWHAVDRTTPAIDPVVPPSAESTQFVDLHVGWDVSLAVSEQGRLALGIEGRQERGENESTLFLPPVAGGDIPGDYDLDRATGAALADWSGAAGAVSYELGARLDVPEGFDSQFSPRAGVAWRFAERHRVRASVARSFKLPSFYALGSPAALGGNPDLEPERSTGGDLGYELDAGTFRGSLTLFALRFDDLIDFDFTTFQLVNRANVDSRGAELGLFLAATKELDLRLDVAYQDVENDETGEPLRRRPEWTGGLRAVWRPAEAWRVEGDVQSVSEQLDQQVPEPTRDTVDGFVVVGGGAAYRVGSRWTAEVRLDNLLDEEYETLIGFPGPGRTFRASIAFGG
jgi:outer membrane cobalamin receptor